MPGKVYCFNAYNESINQLSVNGLGAGSVGGWTSSGAAMYTPAALAVPRARYGDGQSVPVFGNDRPTPVRVEWDSFQVQTTINLTNLPNVSLDDDLILYFAVNQATLMTTRGFVLLNQPLSPSWDASAKVAQSDVPDNMLARLTLVRDVLAEIAQSDVPDNMLAKISQSDVPDNLLALLTALRNALAKIAQSDVPDNML